MKITIVSKKLHSCGWVLCCLVLIFATSCSNSITPISIDPSWNQSEKETTSSWVYNSKTKKYDIPMGTAPSSDYAGRVDQEVAETLRSREKSLDTGAEASEMYSFKTKGSSKPYSSEQKVNRPIISEKQKVALDIFTRQPSFLVEKEKISALISTINLERLAWKPRFDISGTGGLSKGGGSDLGLAAAAQFSGEKLMTDDGQTKRRVADVTLSVEIAKTNAKILLDGLISEALSNYTQLIINEQRISIFDYFLNLFDEKQELVESAVIAGVLSKSDLFELSSLRLEVEELRLMAELQYQKNEAFLKTKYASNFNQLVNYLDDQYPLEVLRQVNGRNLFVHSLIELQEQQIIVRRGIAENARALSTSASVSLNAPLEAESEIGVFAGIRVSKPVYDGGKSVEEISRLNKLLNSFTSERHKLEREVLFINRDVKIRFDNFANVQQLVKKNLSLSREVVKDLEAKIKVGRATVEQLVKEFYAKANYEIKILDTRADLELSTISSFASISSSCALLDLCEALDVVFNE